MRRLLIAAALAVTIASSTAACSCEPWATSDPVEIEDCDAEDYANREAECGFTDADRRKAKPVYIPPKKKR